MPSILIRDVPDNIYQKISQRAKQTQRTIPMEILHIIEQHFVEKEDRQVRHRMAVLSLKNRLPEKPSFTLDISAALREGRDE